MVKKYGTFIMQSSNQVKTIQVKQFIVDNGIEKLQNKTVQQNGKTYKIVLDDDDLKYHSLKNPDWNNSKERLNKYHLKGNFRFYAMNEKEMCIWIYPTTELTLTN
mgnify:FL=1